MVAGTQHHGGLSQEVAGQGRERVPDQAQCPPLRPLPAPDSSQITTADAPISISESRPNPASATTPATFQPRVPYSRANPPAQQDPAGGVVHYRHGMSLPATGALPYGDRARLVQTAGRLGRRRSRRALRLLSPWRALRSSGLPALSLLAV